MSTAAMESVRGISVSVCSRVVSMARAWRSASATEEAWLLYYGG